MKYNSFNGIMFQSQLNVSKNTKYSILIIANIYFILNFKIHNFKYFHINI